jgi:hypothetical protein
VAALTVSVCSVHRGYQLQNPPGMLYLECRPAGSRRPLGGTVEALGRPWRGLGPEKGPETIPTGSFLIANPRN